MESNITMPDTAQLAQIIMQIEAAIAEDEKTIVKFKNNRDKARKEWKNLSEQDKKNHRAIGTNFAENDNFNDVQLRKKTRAIRRKLRYTLFRVREGKWKDDPELFAIKSWYEKQFRENWNFNVFTFDWDLSAKNPLKIISPFEWDGDLLQQIERFINYGNTRVDGKYCDPTAFTKQEM